MDKNQSLNTGWRSNVSNSEQTPAVAMRGRGRQYMPTDNTGASASFATSSAGRAYAPPQQGRGRQYMPTDNPGASGSFSTSSAGRAYAPPQQGRGRQYMPTDNPGASGSFSTSSAGRAYAPPQQGRGRQFMPTHNPEAVANGSFATSSAGRAFPPQQQHLLSPGVSGRAYASPQQRPPGPAAFRKSQESNVGEKKQQEDIRSSVRGKRIIPDMVHTRPLNIATKCGSSGTPVTIQSNYYRVLTKPHWKIHQYRVDFMPDVDMVRLRRAYLGQHKELFGGYIFDGTVLFCTKYFIEHCHNGQIELMTKNREGETIQIKIKHVGIVEATDAQLLQVLNLILRRSMEGLELQLVGRNFFDPRAKICMDKYRMEIWPGYLTSIRQHEHDILLCAEITHKVMRTETVYNILMGCLQGGSDFQHSFKQQVVGSIVLTDYNNKTYRVDDVDFQTSPMSTFPTKTGEISYDTYYRTRYNIQIRDKKQPLLVSRPTERNIRGGQEEFILLVPELCRATGLTDAMRRDFNLMRAMADQTRLTPRTRLDRLKKFNDRLQESNVSIQNLQNWNMQLDRHPVEFPGRILPAERIVFGNRTHTLDQQADWSREFRSSCMYSHVDLKRWCVIVPKRNVPEIQEFLKICIRAAGSMKMRISEPAYEIMPDDRNNTYSVAIDRATSKDPQILMILMPNNNEEKYACIKKKCCVDRPIPSQVVTQRVIAPRGDKQAGLMSIATKIVIQMNAKLMGAPWMIELPLSGLMTVGFDVSHSKKERNKSYGALVATMDLKKSSKYFSAVTAHMKGQELSNEITVHVTCALKSYRATHGTLPERILFYRDGVGEGQLHQVYDTELKYLKTKLDEIYKSAGVEAGCRLAFIVVTKRINTRYFVNGQNPIPGTVVDDYITLPERYDFYLVSQSVRQGTVAPTSYNVIHDNMGLSADRIQMLTYKMCHMYYNWSGTVRVPAVCQYAHKLAFLVAESLHRAPSNALENQLYFL